MIYNIPFTCNSDLLIMFIHCTYNFAVFMVYFYRGMCLQYAELETKLGEIDRARGVYSHGSQFSDPKVSIFL